MILAVDAMSWCAASVPENDNAHMRLIHRWLGGEIVNNHVGIKVRGGPFDGKIRIMALDTAGKPPLRTRGPRARAWHVYLLVSDPDETSSWIYQYERTEEET